MGDELTLNRRDFLKTATLAGVGFWVAGSAPAYARRLSANDKLNVAIIGCGGRGHGNLEEIAKLGENIVALCDVDDRRAAGAYQKFPGAAKYRDFRRMFDERKDIDAVAISTPDHMHAVPAMMAMQRGIHVYCEKPLTHTVHEARALRRAADRYKVATQMGNNGKAGGGHRRSVEIVQAGAIGDVTEVHVWTDRPIWPQGMDRPAESKPVPEGLDWDLWLGVAPERPYHDCYLPFNWRGWWDFGCGALGDMACHNCDFAFWSLKLGYPRSIEAEMSDFKRECAPKSSTIRFEFPKRGKLPPVTLYWHDGGRKPPQELAPGVDYGGNGTLMIGSKGTLLSYGSYANGRMLLPEKDFEGYEGPPETIPRSPGHHAEWVRACKGGPAAFSDFDYAGPFTEAMLLGNLALRVGHRIEWDGRKMRVTNCDEANELVRKEYRKGWECEGL